MSGVLLLFSWEKDISVVEEEEDILTVCSRNASVRLEGVSSSLKIALKTLRNGAVSQQEMEDLVLSGGGFPELTQFYYHLENFIRLGWVCHTIALNDKAIATMIPYGRSQRIFWGSLPSDRRYIWSRFAYLRREKEGLVLEAPLSSIQIILSDWRGGAIIAALAQPKSICDLMTEVPGIEASLVERLIQFFLHAKMVDRVEENHSIEPENNQSLAAWEFHDLLFHVRSRRGRHPNPVGKTFQQASNYQSPPAIAPKTGAGWIDLFKPDIETLKQRDRSFCTILEARKSTRTYGSNPITCEQLGEFLYRTARVRTLFSKDRRECSSRPYPSGGACYELELYLAVNRCKNLSPGLYRYCPLDHQLGQISPLNPPINQLIREAEMTAGSIDRLQILIVVTARFGRVNWLYQSMAYSLILKHVGVLYQTMYLVATAMNLGACALGTGTSDLSALILRTNCYEESSVGEFILGSLPDRSV